MRSPHQFDHALLHRAKAEMVAAALANGIVPAHNVTLELKDIDFIYNDARRARDEFGFLRQWCIYPAQIEPITRAMAPSQRRSRGSRGYPAQGLRRPTGARSSTRATSTTAPPTATTGSSSSARASRTSPSARKYRTASSPTPSPPESSLAPPAPRAPARAPFAVPSTGARRPTPRASRPSGT